MMSKFSVVMLAMCCSNVALHDAHAAEGSKRKPIAAWTCSDFLSVDDTFKPKVVYAASAASQGAKPTSTFIDIAGTEMVTPMIIDDCSKAPSSSFMEKVKADWSKVKADAKAGFRKLEKAF